MLGLLCSLFLFTSTHPIGLLLYSQAKFDEEVFAALQIFSSASWELYNSKQVVISTLEQTLFEKEHFLVSISLYKLAHSWAIKSTLKSVQVFLVDWQVSLAPFVPWVKTHLFMLSPFILIDSHVALSKVLPEFWYDWQVLYCSLQELLIYTQYLSVFEGVLKNIHFHFLLLCIALILENNLYPYHKGI